MNDILNALVTDDLDVVISTGSTGAEAGNILWDALADLDFNGLLNDHSLTLLTDATATVGSVTIDADITDSVIAGAALSVTIDTAVNNGNVSLNGLLGGLGGLDGLNVMAGTGTVSLTGTVNSLADVNFAAGLTNVNADITLTGATVLADFVTFQGDVDFGGGPRSITVTNALLVSGVLFNDGDVTVDQNLTVTLDALLDVVTVGGADPTRLEVQSTFTLDVILGGLVAANQGVVAGTGTVDADVFVLSGGTLAPGTTAAAGTLTVANGNVDFDAQAIFDVTLGATTDQLLVTGGDVSIDLDAILQGSGFLTVGTPVTLVNASGAVNGQFQGTGGVFLLGDELVTANYTMGPPGSLMVQQVAAQPGKTFSALTPGGDIVTVTLVGPGQLAVEENAGVIDFIVVRNSKAASTLRIVMTPNGGPGTADIGTIVTQAGIGKIIGPAANVNDGLEVNGVLGVMNLRNVQGEISLGGTNASKTRITTLQLGNGNLTTTGRIASLVSFGISQMNIQATSIGNLTVKANQAAFLPGELFLSTFTITSRFGLGKWGVDTVNVAGRVLDSQFNILAGNVRSFVSKKFIGSNLYVGYSPPLSNVFTDPGLFLGNFKVNVFRTTATVFPNATTPDLSTLSFADSEVVAARLGLVRLSSVDTNNAGTAFGLKVRQVNNNVGSVRVAAPTPVPFNPATNLQPGDSAGDFMFLQQL